MHDLPLGLQRAKQYTGFSLEQGRVKFDPGKRIPYNARNDAAEFLHIKDLKKRVSAAAPILKRFGMFLKRCLMDDARKARAFTRK